MNTNRAAFSKQYEQKIADLKSSLDAERLNTAGRAQELNEMRTRYTQTEGVLFFQHISSSI
jgi:hypothetical protein